MDKIINYDFSGKRVKFLGKCLDKFSLAFHISHVTSPVRTYNDGLMTVIYDVYSYDDLKSRLFVLLSAKPEIG